MTDVTDMNRDELEAEVVRLRKRNEELRVALLQAVTYELTRRVGAHKPRSIWAKIFGA